MSLRPLILARPFACTATGLALHPASRETAPVCAGFGGVTLRVTLLATEAVLRVLLLALVEVLAASTTTTATVGLVVVSGGGDVEEVFLVGGCDIGSLSLCMFVSILPVKSLDMCNTYSS